MVTQATPQDLAAPYLLQLPFQSPQNDDQTAANWAAIQRWLNGFVAALGGLYASLTGPGETVTPGKLTQAGDFTVNAAEGGGIHLNDISSGDLAGIALVETGEAAIVLVASDALDKDLGGIVAIEGANQVSVTAGDGTQLVLTGGVNPNNAVLGASGITQVYGVDSTVIGFSILSAIGFFGGGGGVKAVVTGSKGGNAALASLITYLASLDLLVDGTS